MKRYDNGEPITKNRIEDEDWYGEYQAVMEFAVGGVLDLDKLYNQVLDFLEPDNEKAKQILRWCVLHIERTKSMPEYMQGEIETEADMLARENACRKEYGITETAEEALEKNNAFRKKILAKQNAKNVDEAAADNKILFKVNEKSEDSGYSC